MRKIEKEMLSAVRNARNWSKDNTSVKVERLEFVVNISVYLFGNEIYKEIRSNDGSRALAHFTLAGWNTVTTRSRLNALGVGVFQNDWKPYFNGIELNNNRWYVLPKVNY